LESSGRLTGRIGGENDGLIGTSNSEESTRRANFTDTSVIKDEK
jgi:hypothetical protein